MAQGWTVNTGASWVALVAATAKTAICIIAGTGDELCLVEMFVGFDGVTASALPVLVELCTSTQAGAGTTTAATFNQIRGRPGAASFTGGINYTVEPTVLTVVKFWTPDPNKGELFIQFPLGREPVGDATTFKGLALRITAPAIVDYRAYVEVE